MALFFVIHKNDYFPRGTYLEEVEPGMVQKVNMVQEGNRYIPMTNDGIVVPLKNVREVCLRIQKRGLDKRW